MELPVVVADGPDITIQADGDQLDQMLINLVRNAVDASLPTCGQVVVSWERNDGSVEVRITDEGPGIAGGANLFVPFFTTKPDGSGIGLVLSRQVVEAHGGKVWMESAPGQGTSVYLRIPYPSATGNGKSSPSESPDA